uniref:Uncharacterized protein n=1 Tax=Ciona intestinalis TaxID=7719 RepID=H2XUI7_CIOIN
MTQTLAAPFNNAKVLFALLSKIGIKTVVVM